MADNDKTVTVVVRSAPIEPPEPYTIRVRVEDVTPPPYTVLVKVTEGPAEPYKRSEEDMR